MNGGEQKDSHGTHRPQERDPIRRGATDYLYLIGVFSAFVTIYLGIGLTDAIVVSALLLGAVVIHWVNRVRPFKSRRTVRAIALTLVVASAAFLLAGLTVHHSHRQTAAGTTHAATASAAPSTGNATASPPASTSGSTTPAPSTPTAPRTSAAGIQVPDADTCGPDAAAHPLPPVGICVEFWCRGDVFSLADAESKKQAQIKIRPKIIDNQSHSLSIAIGRYSAIRLLVAGTDLPGGWKPPPATARASDRPALLTYQGTRYWGLPPNVPHDAQVTDDGQNYTGFATEWSATTVAGGSSYFVPLTHHADGSPVQDGDLVFQVPQDDRIIGIAVVTREARPAVLAVEPATSWPPSSDPSSF